MSDSDDDNTDLEAMMTKQILTLYLRDLLSYEITQPLAEDQFLGQSLPSPADSEELVDLCEAWKTTLQIRPELSAFPEILFSLPRCPSLQFLTALSELDHTGQFGDRPSLTSDEWAYLIVFYGREQGFERFQQLWKLWYGRGSIGAQKQRSGPECEQMMISICYKIRDANRPVDPCMLLSALIKRVGMARRSNTALRDAVCSAILIPVRTEEYAMDEDYQLAYTFARQFRMTDIKYSWDLLRDLGTPGEQHMPFSRGDATYPLRFVINLDCPTFRQQTKEETRSPCALVVFLGDLSNLDQETRNRSFQINEVVFYSPSRLIRLRASKPYYSFWTGTDYQDRLVASKKRLIHTVRYNQSSQQVILPDLFLEGLRKARSPPDAPTVCA